MAMQEVKPDAPADDEEKTGAGAGVTPEDRIVDPEDLNEEPPETPAPGKSKKKSGMLIQQVKPEGFVQEADRWEYLWYVHKRGRTVEAYVEKITFPDNLKTAVWELDLDGVKGVCPLSETGLEDGRLMFRYVGRTVRVKIAGMDKESRVAACSRRAAVAEARERVFETLIPGQVIDVVVKAVLPAEDGKPPRLVVDVGGGVLVEVPRGAATTRRAERLDRLFRPGKQAKAKVIQVDRQTDAIRVSLAAVEADPWAANSYNRGDIVAARVVRQENGILYLETQPGLVGIASPPLRGRLVKGQKVAAAVKTYSAEEHKLHLELVTPLI